MPRWSFFAMCEPPPMKNHVHHLRVAHLLCSSSRDQHVHLALVLPRVAPQHLAGCSPNLFEGMDRRHPGIITLLTIYLRRGHFWRAPCSPSARRTNRLRRYFLRLSHCTYAPLSRRLTHVSACSRWAVFPGLYTLPAVHVVHW